MRRFTDESHKLSLCASRKQEKEISCFFIQEARP